MALFRSQELFAKRFLQADMLGALDGEPVDGVVVDHVRDGGEGSTELAQDILTPCRLLNSHMHEPMAAPENNNKHKS